MVIVIVVVVKCRGERPQKHPLETLDNIGLGLELVFPGCHWDGNPDSTTVLPSPYVGVACSSEWCTLLSWLWISSCWPRRPGFESTLSASTCPPILDFSCGRIIIEHTVNGAAQARDFLPPRGKFTACIGFRHLAMDRNKSLCRRSIIGLRLFVRNQQQQHKRLDCVDR